MKCIFAEIEKFELEFFLFPGDVDEKMKKKLLKLGLPIISIEWPEDVTVEMINVDAGVYRFGEFPRSGLSILEATKDSSQSIKFNPERNSVTLCLAGRYFCYNDAEVEGFSSGTSFLTGKTYGFITGILLTDHRNKQIKTPKDAYGISNRLEALAVNPEYNDLCYRINFKPAVLSGMFKDGQVFEGY